jgi:glyoxylase-like metal-dependent hydrolase (beta-lactamase superfamily II)
MELAPGIHLVDGVTSNTFLVVEDTGLTLVDSGMGGASTILSYIRALGREPGDLRRILLTHQHADHVGNAAEIADATGAEVWAHPLDSGAIAGKEMRDAPHGPLGIVFRLLIFPRLRAVGVAHELQGGDILPVLAADGGLRVVETPGHTRGHVAFYLPGRRLLFAGDALMHRGGRIVPSPAIFNRDTLLARRSFAGLVRLEIEASLPGHGTPILDGAGKRLAETVQRLRLNA